MCKYFHLHIPALNKGFYKISTFFASNLNSSWGRYFRSIFSNEEKKKSRGIPDDFDFDYTCQLFYDVTDTDNWAQHGSTHGRIFAIFRCRFLTIKKKRGEEKSNEELRYSFFH